MFGDTLVAAADLLPEARARTKTRGAGDHAVGTGWGRGRAVRHRVHIMFRHNSKAAVGHAIARRSLARKMARAAWSMFTIWRKSVTPERMTAAALLRHYQLAMRLRGDAEQPLRICRAGAHQEAAAFHKDCRREPCTWTKAGTRLRPPLNVAPYIDCRVALAESVRDRLLGMERPNRSSCWCRTAWIWNDSSRAPADSAGPLKEHPLRGAAGSAQAAIAFGRHRA